MKPELTAKDEAKIAIADAFAASAHDGQTRKSGEAYITHPRAVAALVRELGMDADAICAALLHDTVEDTPVLLEEIEHIFGSKVSELVDGLTKIAELKLSPNKDGDRSDLADENIRKLLLAMNRDLRVVLIKLCDRLHNLRTLHHLSPEKQRRIGRESLAIYAPLADRLGMGALKAELEDLAFSYAQPEDFAFVVDLVKKQLGKQRFYLPRVKRQLGKMLGAQGLAPQTVEGRQKHYYSIFKKLAKVDGDVGEIYDLVAVRVIVANITECYTALGIIHQQWRPLIYRIKDYIAVPKPNGYRSLHTTVFALDSKILEIQIRTTEMHQEAERGVAAHFAYDAHKFTKGYKLGHSAQLGNLEWVSSLPNLGEIATSGALAELEVDLFQDRIFIFSPNGDPYDLPVGATPLDFAFAVHTNVGLRTKGALVNGRIVPLGYKLQNRDMVEILTRKAQEPHRDWLNLVATAKARNRIRTWFRSQSKDANVAAGREQVEDELRTWGVNSLDSLTTAQVQSLVEHYSRADFDAVLAAVGDGQISAYGLRRQLFPDIEGHDDSSEPERQTGEVVLPTIPDANYRLSPCCQPHPPQSLIGYITRGNGVTIHTKRCRNRPTEGDRLVPAHWSGLRLRVCRLSIRSANRVGLLSDVTTVLSESGFNITRLVSDGDPLREESEILIDIQVTRNDNILTLIQHLEQINDVEKVGIKG